MSMHHARTVLGVGFLLGLLLGCGGGGGDGIDLDVGWIARWDFDTPAPCTDDVLFLNADVIVEGTGLTLHLDFPAEGSCETRRITFTGVETAPGTYDLDGLGAGSICQLETDYGRTAALIVLNATCVIAPDGQEFVLSGEVALDDGTDVYCSGMVTITGVYGG